MVFLAAVVIFLSIYFQWQMAVAAWSLFCPRHLDHSGYLRLAGFEVTRRPIGLAHDSRYSLYDTVVVFDKSRRTPKGVTGQSRYTYGELANLALNQTLIRSINTSIVALLPVGAILFVGAGLLGAATLMDLALVLFIGMAVGIILVGVHSNPGPVPDQGPGTGDEGPVGSCRETSRRAASRARTNQPPGAQESTVSAASGSLAPATDRRHRQGAVPSPRVQPKRTSRSKRRS